MVYGPRRWSARSRAGTTPPTPHRARSSSSARRSGAERFATIDPEDFYDFQATRPRVKMVDGQAREIVWPAVELYEARVPRAPRDLILIAGSEPSFRWRTFCQLVTELAEVLNTQLVVTLGALLADVPHTRPVSVTGLTSDPALVAPRPGAVLL